MTKIILSASLALFLAILTVIEGCKSIDAQQKTNTLTEQKTKADIEAKRVVDMEAFQVFKEQIDLKINQNGIEIAQIKANTYPTVDALFSKKIKTLEKRNERLKQKLANYEPGVSSWDTFKTDILFELSEMGKSFRALNIHKKDKSVPSS